MHSVSKSATLKDRRATIVAAAQRLSVSCGYAGFTFDDLAEAVGCSRRTLFNHVASKEEAVLGALPVLTDEQATTLRNGGPTGDLLEDLVMTVVECLGGQGGTVEDLRRLSEIVERNPDLMTRVHTHVDELTSEIVTHLTVREGVDRDLAWVALTIVGSIAGRAVHDCIEDPDRGPLDERIRTNLDLAQELLTTPR